MSLRLTPEGSTRRICAGALMVRLDGRMEMWEGRAALRGDGFRGDIGTEEDGITKIQEQGEGCLFGVVFVEGREGHVCSPIVNSSVT